MLNHYYVLEAAKYYENSKIYIAARKYSKVLRYLHSFLEIAEGIYIDKDGLFTSLYERKLELGIHINSLECFNTIAEAKSYLFHLHVRYGNAESRREASDKVKNYMPTALFYYDNKIRNIIGLESIMSQENESPVLNMLILDEELNKTDKRCMYSATDLRSSSMYGRGLIER